LQSNYKQTVNTSRPVFTLKLLEQAKYLRENKLIFFLIVRIMKSRRMRWAGHVVRMREKRNAYRLLMGKSEVKKPLGRPRRRWVDNIRMDLGEVGWGDVDWIGLAKDRNRWRALVNSLLNLRVP
jgi:hypothetical protein